MFTAISMTQNPIYESEICFGKTYTPLKMSKHGVLVVDQ